MQASWKKLSSKIVYKNPWMKVLEDQVIRPDGKRGIYGYVDMPLSVVILAITRKDEVYIVGQHRYPVSTYSWEIPKGSVNQGETPLAAAQRELLEEAGLKANYWQPIGQTFTSIGIINEVCHIFLAKDLKRVCSKPSTFEINKIKKIPIKKLIQLIKANEIKDGLTIAALMKMTNYSISNPKSYSLRMAI